MSQPPIHRWTPAAPAAGTPEPHGPVTYRTPQQMRRAAMREGAASVPHGAALTEPEARAPLVRAKVAALSRPLAAADPATVVTIAVRRRDWDCPYREFRVTARRAPRLVRHCQRLTGALGVRVRIGTGLWVDVPLSPSLTLPAV